jgi:adenine-specific DNA methylase
MPVQPTLFADDFAFERFPRTRYQGSKRKTAAAIVRHLRRLDYHTALDAFGGTGAVAYAMKCAGKAVTYNDLLAFNHQIGLALIENSDTRLTESDIALVTARQADFDYGDFIERTFHDVYFTAEENRWLDTAVGNIARLPDPRKRALAWFAVCQSAMAKRPYNLFHRRNLYMRTADVSRSFGNKTTWDRPFNDHFIRFAAQANRAVIDTDVACRAVCGEATDAPGEYDLVYLDPPYINRAGVGVDYRAFYHFLEGMLHYQAWDGLIDRGSRHLGLQAVADGWTDPAAVLGKFAEVISRFEKSHIVISYRTDGTPSIDDITAVLRRVKPRVEVAFEQACQYVLSTARATREVLVIGT